MHHVTKSDCNMIGPHCTVWRNVACIRSSLDPFFFVEVGLACESVYVD